MIRFFLTLAALVLIATPADAAPIVAAVKAVPVWFAALKPVAALAVRVVAGVALNAVGTAIQKRQMRKAQAGMQTDAPSGIRTAMTLGGGNNADSMIAGTYATAGNWNAPWVMHGARNVYNSQVIDLSGVPVSGLVQVYVNGSPITLGTSDATIDGQNFGKPAQGKYANHLWVKFYDGTQTAADPMLLARGANDPDFPWGADMVGVGRAYAICTYLENREVWQGVPQFRFSLDGVKFYDMRKDSTIGGVGSHRLHDPSTWEFTRNPIVMATHLAMGYELPDGSIYGGEYELADIPLADAAAAMNACDALVDAVGGGQEPAFRAGLEIAFNQQPIEVIDSLLQACGGQWADVGGSLYFRVGGTGLPVAFITDDDIIVSQPEDLDPFPGLEETTNGLSITHPDPNAAWENVEAPRIINPLYEAADGDRRLVRSIDLPACPYPGQAQRLGQAWVKDARRFARHVLHLPGDLARVRPLQSISWISAYNGYTSKLFEKAEEAVDLYSYQSQVTLREVDPADDNPEAYLPLADISPVVTPPAPAVLDGAGAVAWTITDASGDAKAAIRAFWTPIPSDLVEVEVRQGAEVVAERVVSSSVGRAIIAAEVTPDTAYTVRMRIVPRGRATAWMGPYAVTTPDVRIRAGDLVDSLQTEIDRAFALADGIATGYVWEVDNGGIMRLVQVEDGIGGDPFTAAEIAADYVRIRGLTQIDQAVIQNLAADSAFLSALTVDSANIADSAITNAKIGTAAITAAKIADGQITNAKIVDAAITNAKIGNLSVSTIKVADRAITSQTAVNVASYSISNANTWETAASLSFASATTEEVLLGASFGIEGDPNDTTSYRMVFNGQALVSGFNNQAYNQRYSEVFSVASIAGTNTFQVQVSSGGVGLAATAISLYSLRALK